MNIEQVIFWVNFEEELIDAERSGSPLKVLRKYGITSRGGGYVGCAEGIRIPFDRDKAKQRIQRLNLLAESDVTIDKILSDDSEQNTTD